MNPAENSAAVGDLKLPSGVAVPLPPWEGGSVTRLGLGGAFRASTLEAGLLVISAFLNANSPRTGEIRGLPVSLGGGGAGLLNASSKVLARFSLELEIDFSRE